MCNTWLHLMRMTQLLDPFTFETKYFLNIFLYLAFDRCKSALIKHQPAWPTYMYITPTLDMFIKMHTVCKKKIYVCVYNLYSLGSIPCRDIRLIRDIMSTCSNFSSLISDDHKLRFKKRTGWKTAWCCRCNLTLRCNSFELLASLSKTGLDYLSNVNIIIWHRKEAARKQSSEERRASPICILFLMVRTLRWFRGWYSITLHSETDADLKNDSPILSRGDGERKESRVQQRARVLRVITGILGLDLSSCVSHWW